MAINPRLVPDLTYGMTPFLPGEAPLAALREVAFDLAQKSAHLAGQLKPDTGKALCEMLTFVNSYYSNKIEGQGTHPIQIEAAFRRAAKKRDPDAKVQIAVAVSKVERQLETLRAKTPGVTSQEFIQALHREVYSQLAEEHLDVRGKDGKIAARMVPGALRERDVEVGRHIPYEAKYVGPAMQVFNEQYDPARVRGDTQLVLAAAAHHRLTWVHPFVDGNGRVARLFSHAYLEEVLEHRPVWSIARGLSRTQQDYYARLQGADAARQGDFDGRGARSERGLIEWCAYFLKVALDQVEYMAGILNLQGYRQRVERFVSIYCDGSVPQIPKLHHSASRILIAAFNEGSLGRGEAKELIGQSARTGQNVVGDLLKAGLLTSTSTRAALQPAFPSIFMEYLFPAMAPPES